MNSFTRMVVVAVCCGIAVYLTGCEGDGDGRDNASSVDVTGTWHLSVSGVVFTIAQTGNSVSGSGYDGNGDSFTVSGAVSGNVFTGRADYAKNGMWAEWTVTVSGNTMTGSYTSWYGDSGTMTGTRQ